MDSQRRTDHPLEFMLPAASHPGVLCGAVMGFGFEFGARIVERGSVSSRSSPLDQFQDWACHEDCTAAS